MSRSIVASCLFCLWLLILIPLAFAQDNIPPDENPRPEVIHVEVSEDLTQRDYAHIYNICWEEIASGSGALQGSYNAHFHIPTLEPSTSNYNYYRQHRYFPPDYRPCYNEDGQRLRFYENGEILVTPYYSDLPVYVTVEGDTLGSVSSQFNICIGVLSFQNRLGNHMNLETQTFKIDDYELASGIEIFIPDAPPCYDEQGRILQYDSTGEIVGRIAGDIYWMRDDTNIHAIVQSSNLCLPELQRVNNIINTETDYWHPAEVGLTPIIVPHGASETCPADRIGTTLYAISAFAGPHESFRLVGIIRRDMPITLYAISDTDPTWYRVSDGETNGWVLSYYITTPSYLATLPVELGPPTPTPTATFTPSPTSIATETPIHTYTPSHTPTLHVPSPVPIITQPSLTPFPSRTALPSSTPSPTTDPRIFTVSLYSLSQQHDICIRDILLANPQVDFELGYISNSPMYDHYHPHWAVPHAPAWTTLFLPLDTAPCYTRYDSPITREALHELATDLNICSEILSRFAKYHYDDDRNPIGEYFSVPADAPPCYDDNGHRLNYVVDGNYTYFPTRSTMPVYIVEEAKSVYDISREVNVCVADLVVHNPLIGVHIPYPQLEIFIPDTPPCYDESTGQQIIYEDAFGNPLDEPYRTDYLLHRISPSDDYFHISTMYNVCYNRIAEANRDYLPTVWEQTNWNGDTIPVAHEYGVFAVGVRLRIPTDRPPCFDPANLHRESTEICYDAPFDFDNPDTSASVNPLGDYCYDLTDPETTIWHNGDTYSIHPLLYAKHDVVAWCFNVPTEDILTPRQYYEHPNPESFPEIYNFNGIYVRNMQRDCYLYEEDAPAPDGVRFYTVQAGDNLHSIAWQYGKLPEWIYNHNDLWHPDHLLPEQILMIPGGFNMWTLFHITVIDLTILIAMRIVHYLYRRRVGLTSRKPKKKRS